MVSQNAMLCRVGLIGDLHAEDEALASAVKAVLVKPYPDVEVTSEDGVVFVTAKTTEAEELRMDKKVQELARVVPGVKDVKVHLRWFTPFGA